MNVNEITARLNTLALAHQGGRVGVMDKITLTDVLEELRVTSRVQLPETEANALVAESAGQLHIDTSSMHKLRHGYVYVGRDFDAGIVKPNVEDIILYLRSRSQHTTYFTRISHHAHELVAESAGRLYHLGPSQIMLTQMPVIGRTDFQAMTDPKPGDRRGPSGCPEDDVCAYVRLGIVWCMRDEMPYSMTQAEWERGGRYTAYRGT